MKENEEHVPTLVFNFLYAQRDRERTAKGRDIRERIQLHVCFAVSFLLSLCPIRNLFSLSFVLLLRLTLVKNEGLNIR